MKNFLFQLVFCLAIILGTSFTMPLPSEDSSQIYESNSESVELSEINHCMGYKDLCIVTTLPNGDVIKGKKTPPFK